MNKTDVLLWIDLTPNKLGSFEQYFLQQVQTCRENNIDVHAVFTEGMSPNILELMNSNGVSFTSYPYRFIQSPLALKYEIKRTNCKLVHFHFVPLCSNLFWYSKILGRKTIASSHFSITEEEYNKKSSWPFRFRRKIYSLSIDRVIAVSNFISSYLQKNSDIPENKISMVHNGIDIDLYKPIDKKEKHDVRKSIGVPDSDILVSYAGQLADYKGINDILSAIDILDKTDLPFSYVFIGDGPLKQKITNSNKRINVLGQRNDVNKILAASDIFIAPSTWHEAFGFTFAEASACGLPIIATDTGGIPEIVKDGQSGYLIPKKRPTELAEKLTLLASKPELRIKLGAEGRKFVSDRFTVTRMADETCQLYKKLLD